MRFIRTPLRDACVVEMAPYEDQRGFFARAFCIREFEANGLMFRPVQANVTQTRVRGTIRGLHYQVPPAPESKLIRCTKGALYEVIVDMRPESPTFLKHFGVELSEANHRALYIPEMHAAGCQSLTDDAEAAYFTSNFYTPQCERGLRYDDPALGIEWPLEVTLLTEKDAGWPLLAERPAGTEVLSGAR